VDSANNRFTLLKNKLLIILSYALFFLTLAVSDGIVPNSFIETAQQLVKSVVGHLETSVA